MEQLITIKTFTYPHEAYVVRGRLESEGIQTFMKDEMTVQVNNFYSNAVGGVKLQVLEKDLQRAMEIVDIQKQTAKDIVILRKSDIKDPALCPFCGSTNIIRKKNATCLTLLPFILIGTIFPAYKRTNVCFGCSQEWMVR